MGGRDLKSDVADFPSEIRKSALTARQSVAYI